MLGLPGPLFYSDLCSPLSVSLLFGLRGPQLALEDWFQSQTQCLPVLRVQMLSLGPVTLLLALDLCVRGKLGVPGEQRTLLTWDSFS